ncbi:TolC family protein [Actinobacillus suis]|uniref:Outer membrane channel protein n=3 Tax=Actinobacillus suis TaxID=716 RepID=K0FY30_ACTSU|nr:TolC family protein [Actinobacillus suis]AFU19392.1 outer membrane channel protein [Actinobacillus suis H91-0380]AIJ31530.1 outer membrane channel protein [Actinobacillus suis ATCC 33415]MCO4166491.1 TolC family protein [Actinobacillus suis]MCO4168620.1 TolC family protein [Actinobacillus suis]MCQ9630360.1 TolC family protein [Actinobacillus suis]
MKKSYYTLLSVGLFLFTPSLSQAESLKQILQYALAEDPSLEEARAQIRIAESQTKISEAGHQPVISLSQNGVIAQKHTYQGKRRSEPSLNGRVNLYAWGAIEAEIDRDKYRTDYYQHKFYETRELIGQRIGQLYLSALRAKENIAIYQESFDRHTKLVEDLKVIVSYDNGRAFELTEALSRLNQVESNIARQERVLSTSLSQLARYTKKNLDEHSLQDPFSSQDTHAFLKRYQNNDLSANPTFLAQQKEVKSSESAAKAAEARRMPSINLEGSASRHEREVYVGVSWDIYNQASKYEVEKSQYTKAAAEAKLREIQLDVTEKARTAELEMFRSQKLAKTTQRQIKLQRKVVDDTELQFDIATKSLLNLLDAYQELTSVQAEEVAARNDYRDAALLYLVSQAKVASWAGFSTLNLTEEKGK